MIFKKIRNIIAENKKLHHQNTLLLKEIEWAHIYHDSIRGKVWLENLPLNIGRWAGNYAFFYILNRVLYDFSPKYIVELGLGESSKLISKYLEFELKQSKHLIIEHDLKWFENFTNKFKFTSRSTVEICPLIIKKIKEFNINLYKGLIGKVSNSNEIDLYIVDGPFGSPHYSRYDIISLLQCRNKGDEFVIIIDDYNRRGEKETVEVIIKLLLEKEIVFYKGIYEGNKSVFIIGTEKYRFINSL